MSNHSKYTLLLMRDDTQARCLRFSSFWLKFLAWALFLLLGIAGAGSWGTYYLWQKERVLNANLIQLERNNSDLKIKLERLQNMETLIGASESIPLDPVLDTGPGSAASRNEAASDNVSLQDLPALVDIADNATESRNATSPEDDSTDVAVAPGEDSPVKLENITFRANSNKTLRLSMNFVNTSGKSVRGHGSLSLVTASGAQPVTVPTDDLDFQMARLKRATTTFPLPEGVSMDDVRAVRITVLVDDVEVLTEEIPLER